MGSGTQYDVVVIGGGMAGLVTAVRAAEHGLDVAVLEKGDGERYLCNARMSGGVLHVAFNDPKEPADKLRAAIAAASAGAADADLANVVSRRAGELVDWLRTQGARFIRAGSVPWQNWILAPPRPLRAGIDWMGRGPDVLLRLLASRLRERGGALHLGVRGRSLILVGGRCTGVEAETAQGPRRFEARTVVLADGGFQADTDLLKAHITSSPDKLKQRGAATGTGDGLAMAEAVGAALTPLTGFYGHLLCRDAMHSDKVWPYPELDGIAVSAIVVDAGGWRILDEGMGGVWLANQIAALPDPLCASIVFDSAIWDGPGRSARIPANPALEIAGGTIHKAATLAELALQASLDANTLQATVERYNAAVRNATPATLTPPRSTDRFKPWPVAVPPYYAIPICAGITYTFGGIRIDADARVLSRDGTPIPGLYAAGSTTGGLEGGERATYLGGLAKAGVLGLCAADHITRTFVGEKRKQGDAIA